MDKDKKEKGFIARLKTNPEIAFISGDKSVMEGFQYYKTEEYRSKPGAVLSRPKALLSSQSTGDMVRLVGNMGRIMPSMFKNINKNYDDMEGFLDDFEKKGLLHKTKDSVVNDYPNTEIWEDLKRYSWEKHRLIVGFTEIPQEYIFQGKAIPFRYSLVFAQEMDKDAIEKAPKIDAGIEVIKVYNSLGIATNDIANWLRKKYGVVCMANHPLGGLVDTVPLAQKAGIGCMGRSGLLITQEFGPRCRISPIFIDEKIFEFTDSEEHMWIEDFCRKCGKCMRECPTDAIYDEKKLSVEFNKKGLIDRYNSYDRERCFQSFAANMGCAVCISVCPFSKNPNSYDKIKLNILKRKG